MSWSKYLNKERIKPSTITFDDNIRNAFESDFGRVIFSPAMRRMHDKTQVFPLTTDDHIHSRLTHSMEVMAIGYSLGVKICADIDFVDKTGETKENLLRAIPVILKNACLVHDIGNPPFGHFGETVIQQYFKDLFEKAIVLKSADEITDVVKEKAKKHNKRVFVLSDKQMEDFQLFDGNAQGFRILTRLQALNNEFGLNLTYATLGAYLKYPNADDINDDIATSKRGVFQSERDYLDTIVNECGLKDSNGLNMRHPLSFLMEAADSICYYTMDIEDGFSKGWYNYEDIENHLRLKIDTSGKTTQIPETDDKDLLKELDRINNIPYGYGKEISKVVALRIYLIEKLVNLATTNFLNNLEDICQGKYRVELVKDDINYNLAKKLANFCGKYIFPKREILSLELTGHAVLKGLMDYYIDLIFHEEKKYRERASGMISNSIYRAVQMENKTPENDKDISKFDDYSKLRIIVDFITGMTDQFALDHYQKLSGQKIS